MSQGHRIQVKGVWKVFGEKPERALEPEYASKSRTEIQEELGAVVALRDVSFDVSDGQIFVVMGPVRQRQIDPGALSYQAHKSQQRGRYTSTARIFSHTLLSS